MENPEIFIEQFNWVNKWINIYFFNKVSDFLGGLILLSIIIFFSFINKQKVEKFKIKKFENLIILYFINFIF